MPRPSNRPIRLVTSVELAARLDVHRNTVLYRIRAGLLPRPILVGGVFAWRADVADQVVAEYRATRPDAPPAA